MFAAWTERSGVPARALAIGGLLILATSSTACDQWRARFSVAERGGGKQAAVGKPMPDSAYRVRWDSHTVPAAMARGTSVDARITFTNLGNAVWPDALAGDPKLRNGTRAVRLAYGWTLASDPAGRPNRRAELPRPVHPGETMTLLIALEPPDQPGEYRLTFELLQELVSWFSTKGAAPLVVPVTVR
jgi:hypothetical protein